MVRCGWTRRLLAAGAAAALLGGLAQAPAAAREQRTVWLCAPELADDPCRGGLPTTDERAGGVREAPEKTSHPIDCFYVYPTVAQELTPNASLKVTPPVASIARHQAARFSDVCEVYAPVYRQRTLTALAVGSLYGPELQAETARIAYGDVLNAWREYLAERNGGRGVVLIGHSQGTGILRRLIREEIDPDPAARGRLVSALLLGGTVAVRKGADRGGDFQNIPLCREASQTGCVITWAAFSKTPPEDTLFGRVPAEDNGSGFPSGPDYEAACTNPTSLRHNLPGIPRTIWRTDPVPGLLGLAARITYGGTPPTAATPWLIPADRYAVRCARENGAHVLRVTALPGARPLHAAPLPSWGIHLLDINIALGDLLHLIRHQTRTHTT